MSWYGHVFQILTLSASLRVCEKENKGKFELGGDKKNNGFLRCLFC